jgi:hypothetical protein
LHDRQVVLVLLEDPVLQIVLPENLVGATTRGRGRFEGILNAGRASFDVNLATDAAGLIPFHAPPPVGRGIKKLAQDPSVAVLLRQVQLHGLMV